MTKKLLLSVTKPNARPNAPYYEFETVEQLFDVATEENVERMAKSITDALRQFVALRGIDPTLHLHKLTWTDD